MDQTFDYCPEIIPDKFIDIGFTPIYSDDSFRQGVTQGLVGSAEGVKYDSTIWKLGLV